MPEDLIKSKAAGQDVSAVVLAGGYSTRMKDFKPLLPLGGSTIVENTVNIFRNAGIRDITVVTGYRAEDLRAVLDRAGIRWVYNANYPEGMYSSVIAGVHSLRAGTKGFFLLPADMPLVKKDTIHSLLREYRENGTDIIYPVFNGKRGHPPFISLSLFSPILAWDGSGGLRALLAQYQDRVKHVEVQDEGILTDLDSPEDYTKLCRHFISCSSSGKTGF